MANNQIQNYADMVNLQVASEAFWGRLNGSRPQTVIEILSEGNKNNSKEPIAVVDLFDPSKNGSPAGGARYKLIAHQDLSLNEATIWAPKLLSLLPRLSTCRTAKDKLHM